MASRQYTPVVVRETEQVLISINSEWHLINRLVTAAAAETTAMIRVAESLNHLIHTYTSTYLLTYLFIQSIIHSFITTINSLSQPPTLCGNGTE